MKHENNVAVAIIQAFLHFLRTLVKIFLETVRPEKVSLDDLPVYLYNIDEKTSGNGVRYFSCELRAKSGIRDPIHSAISLAPDARWKLKEFFESFGIDVTKEVDVELARLVGKAIRVSCVYEEYGGKKYLRVRRFLRPSA